MPRYNITADDIYDIAKAQAKRARAREKAGIVIAIGYSDIQVQPIGSPNTVLCEFNPQAVVGDHCTYLWVPDRKRYIISALHNPPKTVNPPVFNKIVGQSSSTPDSLELAQVVRDIIGDTIVEGTDVTVVYDAAAHTITISALGGTLSEITDIDLTSLTDQDLLMWVAADNKWENTPLETFTDRILTGHTGQVLVGHTGHILIGH